MFRSPTRLLLYLANDQLWAYEWRGRSLSAGRVFALDQQAALLDYLDDKRDCPAYLAADLVEEDFQRHAVPHVGGKAGRNMIERKLNQLFRDTPYRYATVLERESGGRRDDSILFCALTNPAAVQPWVHTLEQARVPLVGLYSLAALSGTLIPSLDLQDDNLLLISRQAGGLRQSYFKSGSLRFSRLTPAIEGDDVARSIIAEAEKTRQFLTSSRLMARGEQLGAVVLGTDAELAALEPFSDDGLELAYDLWPLDEVAQRLQPRAGASQSAVRRTEQVLLPALARLVTSGSPVGRRTHYPLGKEKRFYQLWLARFVLYRSSALMLLIAIVWTGLNLAASYTANTKADQLEQAVTVAEQRNRTLLASLPHSAANPADMQAAVSVERLLAVQGPMPAPMLAIVSAALDAVPAVRLTRLDWRVALPGNDKPAASLAHGPVGTETAPAMSSLLVGVPTAPPQQLELEAEVQLSASDERAALAAMNRFAQLLARTPRLQVAIKQPLLDIRPGVKLAGKAGADPAAVPAPDKFILSLAWQP